MPVLGLVAGEARDREARPVARLVGGELPAVDEAVASVVLRDLEGLSYEEIAATLDLPLGTVKTYIHRARHELRRLLEHVRDGGIGPLEEGEPA